jgi:heptosyltransferase-2
MVDRSANLRSKFYGWRQRHPVKRLVMGVLFLVLYPFRLGTLSMLSVLWRGERRRRIIIIHLAGLGDMLMLTPTLAVLRAKYPDSKIELITLHEYVKDAFDSHPSLDKIHTLSAYPGPWIVSRFSARSNVGLVVAAIRLYSPLLLKHSFSRCDIGFNFGLSDFDRNLGNALLFCLSVRKRIGSDGVTDKLLTDRVCVDYQRTHRVTAYLSFLKPLGLSSPNNDYEFPVREIDLDRVKLTLRREKINLSKPLAVLNPGGKIHINSRRWPAKYYAQVSSFLSREAGFQVVLTGDREDREVCDEIAQSQTGAVVSTAGRFSFAETAALLSLSQLCITNDTSTLHLAEAVKVPRVVSIFGPTDPDLLAAKNERHFVFRSNLDCAP